ncbi:uncharacterized protein EV420DRAFT_1263469 [Desarmillaria tabescens]|uniref:U4/U6 snRNA-associated-splicing factor PRP24 n=1 Tax=Armillaria tabescens TaxID=1929756 RepID=A0AA39TVI2_ARMTA|nr:uncharacterized protein EV420DRAFT_1263469 [Desarmillaria tabescens]KAK0464624.1 hypothetical protein EV420DRAFT_1263469 [Desarmillaria tabescens]
MNEAQTLDALANVLNDISEKPYDFSLHVKHINIARSLEGMESEFQSAIEMMSNFYSVGGDLWLELIEYKKASLDLGTVDGVAELLAVYERAESDYTSIPLLKGHIEFVLEQYARYCGSEATESKPDTFGELFSEDWTRTTLSDVVKKGQGHITQSHVLWDMQRDWELEMLEAKSGSDRIEAAEQVQRFLLERLRQPHSNSDDTFQTYSSFTTNHKPPQEYEPLLIAATKIRSQAVKSFQRREAMETALVQSNFSLESYASYVAYENRARYPELLVMGGLYERAIAEAAKRKFAGEAGAEDALRSFWIGYCDAVRTLGDESSELQVLRRAIRSAPASGDVWARNIRYLERTSDSADSSSTAESVSEMYNTALGTNLLQSEVEQIIPVVLARAGFEKRMFEAGDGDDETFATLIAILESGIDMVRKANSNGDQWLRLEKYLSEIYRVAGLVDNLIKLWQTTAKHYKTSYMACTLYTDCTHVGVKNDRADDARKVFQEVHRKQFDWPEAIWDAWVTFEHFHGTVEEINSAMDNIETIRLQVNARRAKEAEKASRQYAQMAAEQLVTEVATVQQQQHDGANENAMEVESVPSANIAERGTKRRSEDDDAGAAPKRAKTGTVAPRDRENCTVFVADLPSNVNEDDLRAVFQDCGTIRAIKISPMPEGHVATVEFAERECIPAALTKDKKRIHQQEIAVHLAWQSTLYITNFPESADDAYIRKLFGEFGVIFDVRWPSKKFKNTRRFCYVQYTSPAAAQAALSLHGKELEPHQSLSVLISNPERKKDRTDHDADNKEIYVAGLNKMTSSDDLRKLFEQAISIKHGEVKDVRMATDQNGQCKGYAFVEYKLAEHATAALQLNNFELKKRHIAVTMSDPRAKARQRNKPDADTDSGLGRRADVRSRSVRIHNLPQNTETQEGLLQQTIEKIVAVARVEVLGDTREAVVELATAADAGKLLLRPEPLEFGGKVLKITEEAVGRKFSARNAASSSGGMFVPRTATSRPRAGLGHAKKQPAKVASSSTASKPSAASATSKGQDDFRSMLGN